MDLPLEELLRVGAPDELRRRFCGLLQESARAEGYCMAAFGGAPAAFIRDRRATHLIGVVTDAERRLQDRLEAWGFEQMGHSHIHPFLRLHVHVVAISDWDGGFLREAEGGVRTWEPEAAHTNEILAILESRRRDISEAIGRSIEYAKQLYLDSGQMEIIGPRERRFHIGEDRAIAYLRQQGKL